MIASIWIRLFCFGVILTAALTGAAKAAPMVIASIDLSKSFGTRSLWSFQATQGSEIDDPGLDQIPGAITLCLSKSATGVCDPSLLTAFPNLAGLDDPSLEAFFGVPHYLYESEIVYPEGTGHAPLLLVQTASASGGDGNRGILTQVLAYNRANDHFFRIYSHFMGSNNDQEARFINAGPMRGDIISVDPTSNAPFAFWIVVNALTPSFKYRQVLRYRSATLYGDQNQLLVIDSEMPNIQQRLGLWHTGLPLPLPASGCSQPQLIHDELWCH
jgi:hypothetical protein